MEIQKKINLIGINGIIGSGKDTVGKIIQYLDLMKFTGETPDAQEFKYWYIDRNHNIENSKWQIKKFAGKLKQIASLMTGIPVEKFEDQEFKKKTFQQLVDEGYISKSQLDILKNI